MSKLFLPLWQYQIAAIPVPLHGTTMQVSTGEERQRGPHVWYETFSVDVSNGWCRFVMSQ